MVLAPPLEVPPFDLLLELPLAPLEDFLLPLVPPPFDPPLDPPLDPPPLLLPPLDDFLLPVFDLRPDDLLVLVLGLDFLTVVAFLIAVFCAGVAFFFSALLASACFLPSALIPNEPALGLVWIPVALAAASPFALESLYYFAFANAFASVCL